jgi:superfamily II DNA or RNA helicase
VSAESAAESDEDGRATDGPPLRRWQRRALTTYLRRRPLDFLAVATPGAGKTTFALKVAAELLADHTVAAITVVVPTEHLKGQWAAAARVHGIALDPTFANAHGRHSRDYHGVVVTYAQVAAHPVLHRSRTENRRTLVVFDEVHHAGDAKSWGEAVLEAFAPATRRLSLTGTPFRSDDNPIPFVRYEPGADGLARSAADSSYGYGDALADGVVRPVLFLAYSGQTRWRTRAGDEVSATLGEPLTSDATARAWRTALDPKGEWIPAVLAAADTRLTQVRAGGQPDAGGLVIATDRATARAYAKLLHEITGSAPVVVLSDEAGASARIARFGESDERWMVAVRMVSEGVDVPRLAVGVYATNASTPLYFAQAIGRFVRSRRPGEAASVFLPSVPVLLALAADMEATRDHVLGAPKREGDDFWNDAELAAANAERTEAEDDGFEALHASAELDQLIFDGASIGAGMSQQDEDFVGLPGLLSPEQVSMLLSRQKAAGPAAAAPAAGTGTSTSSGGRSSSDGASDGSATAKSSPRERELGAHERRTALRRELSLLVAARHHRTGAPHAQIHGELRSACGGPQLALATADEVQQRIDMLRAWAAASTRSR